MLLQPETHRVIALAPSQTKWRILVVDDSPENINENISFCFEQHNEELDFKSAKEKFLSEFYDHYFGNLIKNAQILLKKIYHW